AMFRFTGTAMGWMTRKGPDMGNAQVLIDGVSKGTVNLNASNSQSFTRTFTGLASGTHTIVIKVLHQTQGTRYDVVVDAFISGTTPIQDTDCKVKYDTWICTANAKASGGTWRSSSAASASARLTFTGSSINWLTATGAVYGKASVCIDSSCSTV